MAPLLDQINGPIVRVTADGAYDGAPTYQTIAAHGEDIEVVIPPRATAVASGEPDSLTQRNRQLTMITERGQLAWQTATGYGQRSPIKTTIGRYKLLIGPRLRARNFAAKQTEVAIGVAVLNRMLAADAQTPSAASGSLHNTSGHGVTSLSLRQVHQRPLRANRRRSATV